MRINIASYYWHFIVYYNNCILLEVVGVPNNMDLSIVKLVILEPMALENFHTKKNEILQTKNN